MPKPRIDLEELSRFFRVEKNKFLTLEISGKYLLPGYYQIIEDFWFYLSKQEYTIPSLSEWRRMCEIKEQDSTTQIINNRKRRL